MLKSRLSNIAFGLTVCAGLCLAQSASTPSLTTADVLKWREAHPELASVILPPVESGRGARVQAGDKSSEKAWNDALRAAREKARSLERQARQLEIRASESRSLVFFGDPNSLNARNESATELSNEAKKLSRQAAEARSLVRTLLLQGQSKGYAETVIDSRLPSGAANPEYYRQRYLELSQELDDAEAELRSDSLRANRFSTAVNSSYAGAGRVTSGSAVPFYPNRGAGDLFFANRLYARFSESSAERDQTNDRVNELKREIENLREEGRRAGLPPGLFR